MIARKYLILTATVGTLVSFDQLTKLVVTESLAKVGESHPVVDGLFQITRVHNKGAAFGVLANLAPSLRDPVLFLVPTLVLAVILYAFTRLAENQLLSVYSLSLVVGGAIGNFVDRLRLGWVIDFLDFHWRDQAHFPAFNLADSAITVGVILLFASLVYEQDPIRAPADATHSV